MYFVPRPSELRCRSSLGPRLFLCWLIAGVCELPFLRIVLTGHADALQLWWSAALTAHTTGALLLWIFAAPRGAGWRSPARLWALTFATLIFLIPLFGWLSAAGLFWLQQHHTTRALPAAADDDHWPDDAHTPEAAGLSAPADARARIADALDLLPLMDILAGTDIDLQRGAIERMAELRSPDAIQTLLQLRSNASPEIRFYVTSQLTRIKQELDEELESAKRQMHHDIYKISARVFLAKLYHQYARSGLLDATTAAAYLTESLYHCRTAIASPHATAAAYRLMIALQTERAAWDDALHMLDKFSESRLAATDEVARARAELLFRAGRFEDTATHLAAHAAAWDDDPAFGPIVRWWA